MAALHVQRACRVQEAVLGDEAFRDYDLTLERRGSTARIRLAPQEATGQFDATIHVTPTSVSLSSHRVFPEDLAVRLRGHMARVHK